MPPVRFSLGSPTFSYTNPNNTLNAPDVRNLVQASESLQAVLRNSDYYEPPSGDLASPHANSHARESPDNIRRREFFAAREANAAILSATHGSNDSNRGFNITTPSLGTFQPPSSMRPSASVGSHPLPWVRNYPTPGDGLSPYGLFPTVQNNHKNEHIQPHVTPSKPTLDAAPSTTGNVMKPNIYEQILSSEVARSRQADLDRIKENLKEFLLKDIATPWTDIGEDEDEMAMSDASEDNISESECVEDMEEGIEDTHTDIRTDVSEAGSNATSTERRNAALMTDLNDAPTFNSDPWRGWRPVSLRVVETTSARGFPISSLVNQNAAETPKGPVLEVKMQDRDDTSTQVFELDVATAPRGTKRKFEAEDMVEDVIEDVRQENEGADQKEVAGTMSAVNSDEDVPKEVTLDGVTNKVASLDIKEESSSNGEPSRKKQRTWPTITTSFALGAVMGGVGVFAALVASAP